MPWKIQKDDKERWCVYKETADGEIGEVVHCHATKGQAEAQLRALYASENRAIDPALFVKALGAHRIGAYGVLWGHAGQPDLTGEYFTPDTAELDVFFKSLGKLPLLYHHAGDTALKTEVIGTVDVLAADDTGMWYEAQLALAGKYRQVIQDLIDRQALGTSTGTLPRARKAAVDGRIERWPIVEISLTPTPAEPRTLIDRPVAAIKAAYHAIGLEFPDEELLDTGAEEAQSAAKSREIALELERLALLTFEVEL